MTIVSSDLPFTAFVILFSFLWPLYRQIFRLQFLSFYSLSYEDLTIQWSQEREWNYKRCKRKIWRYNGHKKENEITKDVNGRSDILFLVTIVSSDLPFTSFVISFSFLWSLYRQIFRLHLLSFYSLSYDHCIVRSSVYIFCNFILFLMTIVNGRSDDTMVIIKRIKWQNL
jgi:hypothetical protein